MTKLLVLITSQVIFTAIVTFIIIPFLKIKDIEFKSISISSFFTFTTVLCLYWAIQISFTLSFSLLSNIFDINADLFGNVLPISTNYTGGLISIIIWLIAGTLGLAIVLEYLYRRTLIPLLEKRGMSPFSAVLTSSCAFALVNIPFNLGFQITFLRESILLNIYLSRYDLGNSLFYSFNLFFSLFILGLSCGIVYILTKNILFSIMIHSLGLLPYYLLVLFNNNGFLFSLLSLLLIIIYIVGLLIALYTFHSLFLSSRLNWVTNFKKKSTEGINRGLVGFFVIFFSIIIYLVVFLGLLAEHAPIVVTILFHIIFLGFCFKYLKEDLMRNQLDIDHHETEGKC